MSEGDKEKAFLSLFLLKMGHRKIKVKTSLLLRNENNTKSMSPPDPGMAIKCPLLEVRAWCHYPADHDDSRGQHFSGFARDFHFLVADRAVFVALPLLNASFWDWLIKNWPPPKADRQPQQPAHLSCFRENFSYNSCGFSFFLFFFFPFNFPFLPWKWASWLW